MEINTLIAGLFTIVGSIIGALLTVYFGKKQINKIKSQTSQLTFIEHNDSEWISEEFMAKYIKSIRNAKHNIYITGSGSGTSSGTSKKEFKKASLAILQSLEAALENGVNVTRVQLLPCSKEWREKLLELKKKYTDTFNLYFLPQDKSENQLVQFFVADPDSSTDSVIDILFPTVKNEGTVKQVASGTALFINGNKELAQYISSKIVELKENC